MNAWLICLNIRSSPLFTARAIFSLMADTVACELSICRLILWFRYWLACRICVAMREVCWSRKYSCMLSIATRPIIRISNCRLIRRLNMLITGLRAVDNMTGKPVSTMTRNNEDYAACCLASDSMFAVMLHQNYLKQAILAKCGLFWPV